MNLDILKEASIEYCENIYAYATNYLKNNNSQELEFSIKELTMLEDDIRVCDNIDVFGAYRMLLEHLVSKIEGIINE